jgi:hypothetical protein
MPLVDMKDRLAHAGGNGYAVAAFGLVSLELLEAIVAASERSRSPVILSLAESYFPGRAAGYPTAPPQTRTSAINASGSSDSRFCYVDGVDHPDRGEWIATQEVLESHPRHGGTPGPATEPLLPDFLDRFDELL